MTKRKLAYIWSLRNAVADKAGQYVPYRGKQRYIKSVPESLVGVLNQTTPGDVYELVGVIYDDDAELPRDQGKIKDYGFAYRPGQQWSYPADLQVQGKTLNGLLLSVPSTYHRYPRGTSEHVADESDLERRLHGTLVGLGTDAVVLDGLLVTLDELARLDAPFARWTVDIRPGVTREDSPYECRGAYATLDALYGTRGEKVVGWATMEKVAVEPLYWTGASFHYIDNGIDSGKVFHDVSRTEISPDDTILEPRWNNFDNSLLPALHEGLVLLAKKL